MHGEGTLNWPDGKCYKGVLINNNLFQTYENDKKQGNGIFYFGDGRKYIGTWNNGK